MPQYIIAQVFGAFIAIIMLWILFPGSHSFGHTYPAIGIETYKAFILEFLITFFLMLVISHVSSLGKKVGIKEAFAIGSVILLGAMFAGPITKASMNPARSLAPAIISGNLDYLWLYLTAPFLGAVTAIYCYKISVS